MISWRRGLARTPDPSFWEHARWYDIHINYLEPHFAAMVAAIVWGVPPLPVDASAIDIGCGVGTLASRFHAAYPELRLTLLDADEENIERAEKKIGKGGAAPSPLHYRIDPDAPAGSLPGAPYALAISSTTFGGIVGEESTDAVFRARLSNLLRMVYASLEDWGCLIYGDFLSHGLGVREHLILLEEAGFVDAECVWRDGDLVVVGGQRRNNA
jgi:SAM-dependent methyltransferase